MPEAEVEKDLQGSHMLFQRGFWLLDLYAYPVTYLLQVAKRINNFLLIAESYLLFTSNCTVNRQESTYTKAKKKREQKGLLQKLT